MATRPFAFGVRMRDGSRTLRVVQNRRSPTRYVVEDSRKGGRKRRREHASLGGALRDLARSWRGRLN